MTQSNEDLEATYGPLARYSEHKRGDQITYTTAEGLRSSGVIIWVQAPFESIGVKYVVAPDIPTGFVEFVVPGDVIAVILDTQESTMKQCPYCQGMHQTDQIEQCPMKPH